MNSLQIRLQELNSSLLGSLNNTITEVGQLLTKYSENFPTYTDHSLNHTMQVFKIASEMLTPEEINVLNGEEIYVLAMACILHDIGMCIPENILLDSFETDRYKEYYDSKPEGTSKESMIRDIHHELSYDFIKNEKDLLHIPNEKFAEAIALVSMGHRKVQLDDTELYPPKFFVKDGREFVCLPYLASVLRLADELDITNIRTPKLLTKYYMPNNEVSIKEWEKHIATTQINYDEDKVIFQVNCSDQNNLAALEDQFEKIQDVANYAQKIIRNISNTDGRIFKLRLSKVLPVYNYIGIDPKGIKFSFNVNNVVNTFIGKDLYKDDLTALREVLQNAIDSCRYKLNLRGDCYQPKVEVKIHNDKIEICDNGLGMDEFIIENFFGKLGSSFYSEEEVKDNFEAIGQFGVGVFSYFLLGEYIDIETKTKNNQTLKFRIDKDPKNYFHFYSDTTRQHEGTTITLYLNSHAQNKYSSNDYEEYIINRFRYIEFPIKINKGEIELILNQRKPECNKEKEISNYIKIQHRDKTSSLQVITVKISNDEFIGECSIILPIIDEEFSLKKITGLFSYESFSASNHRNDYSNIEISQMGVFVSSYGCSLLKYTIGQLNLKKSIPINISRNEFTYERDIENILVKFEVELIKKLFQKLNNELPHENKVKISSEFLRHYFQGYMIKYLKTGKDELREIISKSIWLNVYDGIEVKSLTLDDLIKSKKNFVIISEKENHEVIHENLKQLVVLSDSDPYYNSSFNEIQRILLQLFEFDRKILFSNNKAYLSICPNLIFNEDKKEIVKILDDFIGYEISYLIDFDANKIGTSLVSNKKELEFEDDMYYDAIVNLSHPFIDFIYYNLDTFRRGSEERKVLTEIFEIIPKIINKRKTLDKGIEELNTLTNQLKSMKKLYVFSKSDF